jgi:hypothetical protein
LKTTIDPDTVTNKPEVTSIKAWWHVVRTYDEIFADPQYYVGLVGLPGPVGPTGPAGDTGPAGTVDMNALLQLAMGKLGSLAGTLEIRGADNVPAAGSSKYELWLTEPEIDDQGNITSTSRQVTAPIVMSPSSSLAIPANTLMQADGTLDAGTTNVDIPILLTVEYPSWTKMVQASKSITITSKVVTGISISGPSSVYAGSNTSYSLVANYSDGSTAAISGTWAVDNLSYASITAGGTLQAVNPLTQDQVVNINASYSGFSAVKAVTIKQLQAVSLTINGSSALNGGASSTYTATVLYNSGATQVVVPNWSLADTTNGSITAAGVLSTNNVTAQLVIQASYTVPGTTTPVSTTKNVAVTAVVTPIYPYYGTGPALPTDWQSFITSLPYRGPKGNVNASITLDQINLRSLLISASLTGSKFSTTGIKQTCLHLLGNLPIRVTKIWLIVLNQPVALL